MYTAIEKFRLYEEIVEQIERSIMRGMLKPGDRLPIERDLAQEFGVSRTAVREAVKVLQEKGLVQACAGKGTFVTKGSAQARGEILQVSGKYDRPETWMHLVEVREILEPGVAALAALRARDEHIGEMQKAFNTMEAAQQDPFAYFKAGLDFHHTLAEATGNPVLVSLMDSIVRLLREHRLRLFEVKGSAERAQLYHRQILEAVQQRDPEGTREAMCAHMQQARQDGVASFKAESSLPLTPNDTGKTGNG